jgi:hypothetical protein
MNEREELLTRIEELLHSIDDVPSLNGPAALIAACGAAIAAGDEAVEFMLKAMMPVMAQLTLAVMLAKAHNN